MSPYQAFFTNRPTEEIAKDLLGVNSVTKAPRGEWRA